MNKKEYKKPEVVELNANLTDGLKGKVGTENEKGKDGNSPS